MTPRRTTFKQVLLTSLLLALAGGAASRTQGQAHQHGAGESGPAVQGTVLRTASQDARMDGTRAEETTGTVVISDDRFLPPVLTVRAGTTVVWKHRGAALHNVISLNTPALRSKDLKKGDEHTHTFEKPGRYEYYCSYHEGMNGAVIVTDRKEEETP